MDPLANLKDIHLAPPVSNFPWAIGWWLLLALAVVGLVVAILAFRQYRAKRLVKRQVLAQLNQQNYSYQELQKWLKLIVLHYFPREQVAALFGKNWLALLSQQLPPKHQQILPLLQQVEQNLYQGNEAQMASAEQQKAVITWIKVAIPPKKTVEAN